MWPCCLVRPWQRHGRSTNRLLAAHLANEIKKSRVELVSYIPLFSELYDDLIIKDTPLCTSHSMSHLYTLARNPSFPPPNN